MQIRPTHRLTLALLITAGVYTAAAQGQSAAPDPAILPNGMNASIPPELAQEILRDDHPMGSQIRLHEGNQAQMRINTPAYALATASVAGLDVSAYQGNVNWASAYKTGARFAYVKATEGTSYTSRYFSQQYEGSYKVGIIRGAYHFARPNVSSGAAQADYFVAHGGGWSADGKTLPGTVDLEYNPYGATCYGLSQTAMAAWIASFSKEYHAKTKRWPVIYTSTSWWSQCVGSAGNFAANSPLWVARYASSAGSLPHGWSYYTFWQYADSGTFPGDQDVFSASYARLQVLAKG